MLWKKSEGDKEEEGSPFWMVTMSDITILLMTFFVIRISMMTRDERLYMDLKEYLTKMSRWANPVQPGPKPKSAWLSSMEMGQESANEDREASREEIPRPEHLDFRISKRARRYIVHLEGAYGFGVGEYRLRPEQREVLDWLKRELMPGRRNNVVVRGYTDPDPLDAYVLENDTLRPAREGDADADPFLLSSLRAQEVRRYLTEGENAIDERQVRVGEFGPYHGAPDRERGALNRKVEVVISSRLGTGSR